MLHPSWSVPGHTNHITYCRNTSAPCPSVMAACPVWDELRSAQLPHYSETHLSSGILSTLPALLVHRSGLQISTHSQSVSSVSLHWRPTCALSGSIWPPPAWASHFTAGRAGRQETLQTLKPLITLTMFYGLLVNFNMKIKGHCVLGIRKKPQISQFLFIFSTFLGCIHTQFCPFWLLISVISNLLTSLWTDYWSGSRGHLSGSNANDQ